MSNFRYISFLLIFISCAGTSDPDVAGLCELKCEEGATYADTSAKLIVLSGSTAEISCAGVNTEGKASASALGPVTIQFKVERKAPKLSTGGGDKPDKFSTGDTVGDTIPIAGVAFEPIILSGQVWAPTSSLENGVLVGDDPVTQGFNPYKYTGIATPKSQWCTDSCGIGTVEIWPRCIPGEGGTLSLSIHSGPVYPEDGDVTLSIGDEATAN